ncbi:Tigger transposable element-derived protein 1 [Dictyocoela roeselum]|nr:Tigger transposable element-derived protein 1 [Dictyocoela roeselum]
MISELFKKFLDRLNSKMLWNGRKILLILDNAPLHPDVTHSNVELMFLPKNRTSIIQPLDMGVIKASKSHYFNALVDSSVCDFENINIKIFNTTSLKDAVMLTSIAWDCIKTETIENCFKKALVDNLQNFLILRREYTPVKSIMQ